VSVEQAVGPDGPPAGAVLTDAPPDRPGDAAGDERPVRARHRRARAGLSPGGRAARDYGLAGSAYLALAVGLWWHVWTGHPTASTTCGCGDPSLFLWFIEWPAYALTHGHSLFYSSSIYHPGGVNLLSNTSVLALGVPLTPVTLLFGPVASLNVASTLAPALSALAAFWLARRWVSWAPAALCCGLLYGFSPFVLDNLVVAHLMMATLVLPPLILGGLDELLVRQRRPPVTTGVLVGLAVVVEFFVSTELVVILAVSAAIGVVLLVGYAAVGHRAELAAHARGAVSGVVALVVVVAVLLAYPAWYALDGRAALKGAIWPNIPTIGGYVLHQFVDGRSSTLNEVKFGGYYGPVLHSAAYVGVALMAVVVAGLVIWRRDRRLWFFSALAVATGSLALGVRRQYWVPWKLLAHLPLFNNVIEQRFMAVTYLCLAVLVAVVVDRTRWSLADLGTPAAHRRARRALGWAGGAAVAVLALGQVAAAVAPTVPLTVQPVTLPAWFAVTGAHLAPRSVVLVDPAPFSGIQSSMGWQAQDGLRFAMAGGGGPQGVVGRAGAERAGFETLAGLGAGFAPLPTGTRRDVAAVRQALAGWRVTTVVIPRLPAAWPPIQRGNDPQYAAGFLTEVLGQAPTYRDRAWVWDRVDLRRAPYRLDPGVLGACTAAVERHRFAPLAVPRCVAARGTPGVHR